ncbi:MAG: gluconate 2-dehydrogenase subunit 3 family protein [Gemmatimonadales bacterium]
MTTRREAIRLLGGACAVPALAALTPEDLFALGERTHASLGVARGSGFFDMHQLQTVAAAADRIIPVTDTPGALAAECHRFAEKIVQDHYDAMRQKRFVAGLVNLDAKSGRVRQKLFVDLSPDDKDTLLRAVEVEAAAANARDGSFWRDLKYLTVYGYYTSKIGIEEELKTNFYPGRYDGCVPVSGGAK